MSDYKALLKHSGNYFFAMLATKALDLMAIPVYTYLLTVEEYGIYSIFISTVGIATVVLPLNSEVAISRYYFDAKDPKDFKQFVGTSVRLTFVIFMLMVLLMIVFVNQLSEYQEFEVLLMLSVIPVSLYKIVNNIFQQIYQPLLQSRKIAIVSSVQAYLAFALSVICIFLLPGKKYYGQVWGTVIAMLIVGSYSVRQIKEYYIGSWSKDHIKYILSYSIPYLPYSLSGIIIAQLGRLIIGKSQGFEAAGVYSFASNISMVMLVLISIVHSAWNPYYFRYMTGKDYNSIDNDYDIIWRATLICGIGVSLFCYEIGSIVGPNEYVSNLYLIPVLVLGYVFYQWSYVYMRNVGFAKKTIWNAIVVVVSGIGNIVLSAILIKSLGTLGIAISFSASYFIMLLFGGLVNKYILKCYAPSLLQFLIPFIISFPVVVYSLINPFSNNLILSISLKLLLFCIFSFLMLKKYRVKLLNFIKK
ncbi:lipopolysaccharide biosynthesis protein [Bacteroides cellulosilyticus]|mgnify:CR=1 FL=1|jgi:O-antigen/teichoic acid export membrane protein|uniref:lipopolysaccharide biosynthesis protein n=1 Tax=Bacteroides cellulosilyticus TaxID=246787 RepID=UPI00189C93BA|nr:oligosaccharide flippase family protein [Bacteroides cellulosilyticus]